MATAFDVIDRTGFLPPDQLAHWAEDRPLPIGLGQTNSQPRTVADMLRLLDVHMGDRVLDVGAGSGWTTALLAWLTGPSGRVDGVEVRPELVTWGAANLARTDQPWATIRPAHRTRLGLPEEAPYDRILVSAEPARLPQALVEQLVDGGVMVIPVRGTMMRVVRAGRGVRTTTHGSYRFVPLVVP